MQSHSHKKLQLFIYMKAQYLYRSVWLFWHGIFIACIHFSAIFNWWRKKHVSRGQETVKLLDFAQDFRSGKFLAYISRYSVLKKVPTSRFLLEIPTLRLLFERLKWHWFICTLETELNFMNFRIGKRIRRKTLDGLMTWNLSHLHFHQ